MTDKRIEIPIEADATKVKRAAQDASDALDKIEKSSSRLTETTSKQTAAADEWIKKAALIGAAGAAAGAGLVLAAEKAIESTARFKDLGLEVGLAASAISKFEEPAALAGVKLEQVTQAMQRLSRASTDLRDKHSQSSQALRAFNIDSSEFLALKLDEQFELLARQSEKYAGSAEKNAALMALTGRSGAELQKIFAEIAAKGELVATVTDQQAEAADALQDKWALVGLEQKKVARDTMSALTPSLTAVLETLVELKGAGTGWTQTMETIGGVLRLTTAIAGSFWLALMDMGDALGATAAKAAAFFTGDWEGLKAVDKAREENFARNEARFHKLWSNLQTTKDLQEQVDNWDKQGGPRVNFDPKGEAEARRAERAAALEQQREEARLQKNKMDNLKALAAAEAEYEDAQRKQTEAADKIILSLRDSNEMMAVEIGALGKSRVERELLINTEQKRLALAKVSTDYERQAITALYDNKAALIAVRGETEANIAATQTSNRAMVDLGDRIVDALLRGKEGLKDFAREMAAIFLRKWVLNIMASVTGSTSLAAQAATTGSGTAAGSILGTAGAWAAGKAGSLLGVGSGGWLDTTFGTVGGPGEASLISNGMNWGAVGSYGAAAVGGGIGGNVVSRLLGANARGQQVGTVAGSIGATIGMAVGGPIGAVIGSIIGGLVGKVSSRGGDKQGGSYAGQYNSAGGLSSGSSPGWYGVSSENSTAESLIGTTSSKYYDYVRKFGGTVGATAFSAGYDRDPKGDANSRVTFGASVNGQSVFDVQGADAGRSAEELQGALALQASRAILAALQKTDMPASLSKVLNSLNAATASQQQIDDVLQQAEGIKALESAMKALRGEISGVDNAAEALRAQFAELKDAQTTAQAAFDAAMQGTDPAAITKAEGDLLNAAMTRYNTEKQAIDEIVAGLNQLKASAYEFRIANAERINRYGGHVDIGALAGDRMGDLRGQITAGLSDHTSPDERIANINAYLGALDTWVNAQVSSMESAQQQAEAGAQAYAAMAKAAIAAQIDGLQKQLALSQQWSSILTGAEDTLNRMKYSTDNPLSGFGRQALAEQDLTGLRADFAGATGGDKANAANKLLAALQTRFQLAQGNYQRPSDAYTEYYNQTVAEISTIRDYAKTEAERQIDIQQKIESLTQEGNAIAANAAGFAQQASGQLDAIYAQARELAYWAQDQYDVAATEQEAQLIAMRDAITGGMDVALYSAKIQTDLLAVMESINGQITAFLTGASSPGTTTTTTGGGGNIKIDDLYPGGNTGGEIVQPISINIGGQNIANLVLRTVSENGYAFKKIVEAN